MFGSKFQVKPLPRTRASSRLLLAPSSPNILAMPAATRNPVVPLPISRAMGPAAEFVPGMFRRVAAKVGDVA